MKPRPSDFVMFFWTLLILVAACLAIIEATGWLADTLL